MISSMIQPVECLLNAGPTLPVITRDGHFPMHSVEMAKQVIRSLETTWAVLKIAYLADFARFGTAVWSVLDRRKDLRVVN